jgi:two-component system, cell cycle sensor histidine kinase and response regulator CckA
MANSVPAQTPLGNSPWILIVDDEASILPLIGLILERYGMPVHAVQDGEAAMAAIESAPVPPALLICDVLMPGIDGLELTRRILARIQDLKVIFISGHLTDVSWWPEDLREHRFVPKPFSLEELATAVTEVLDAREPLG